MLVAQSIVDLLVTDDSRAKAVVRYELIQFEYLFRRQFKSCCDKNHFSEHKGNSLALDYLLTKGRGDFYACPAAECSLLFWLDRIFYEFMVSCQTATEHKGTYLIKKDKIMTSSARIEQLFKAIAEAQEAPTFYDKNCSSGESF